MRHYPVQHGHAQSDSEDPERPLTDQGVDDVAWVAHLAIDQMGGTSCGRQMGVRPVRVAHSGKTRARQTAEVWDELIGAHAEQADDLAPNDDPTTWAECLDAQTDDVMFVGHLPHLARLAGLLLTGISAYSVISFRQGGLVGLGRAETGWTVSVILPPHRL